MDINLAEPILDEETIEEASRVLSEEFFLRGDSVETFERAFSRYVDTEHAVSVDSGTRAIQLALEGCGIGAGDRVLTTAATFISTANAIVHAGAEPVFVDVDLDTYTLDLDAVEIAVQDQDIDAVVPVHLYGYPVDIDRLRDIVGDIPIVADACQAHGATRDGTSVGKSSDAAGFSFYPSKNITVGGDGGIITTDDDEVARRARTLRDVGRDHTAGGEHTEIGYTGRLNTVNAAIGHQQLQHLNEWNARRREVRDRYTEQLNGVGDLRLPPEDHGEIEQAVYLYVIRTADREGLQNHLVENGVETGIHYERPVHHQPPYRRRGYDDTPYPAAEQWASEVLSLPTHPHLTDREVDYVVKTIESYFEES